MSKLSPSRELRDALLQHERTSRLLQLVLEQAVAISWIVDRDLKITRMDGAVVELFGQAADHFIGRNLREIHSVENGSVDPIPAHLQALRGDDVLWGSEYRGRSFTNAVAPLRDPDGEIVGVMGVFIDVTDARAIERRAREALRVGRMGILDWNLVTNEIEWSPETYKIFGYDPRTFAPTLDATVGMVPLEDRDLVKSRLDTAIAGGAEYDIVHRVVRPDGEVIYVHAQSEVMRDVGGKPLRMLGTITDVTALKRSEEALRLSEQRLRHTLRDASATLWSLDIRTDEVRRRLPGSDRDEVYPRDAWPEKIHPDDRGAAEAALRDALAGNTPEFRAEYRVVDGPGERWGLAFGQLERTPDGTPVRLGGLSLDITDRKRAELELLAVDRRRSDFIAVLSHELRNPLGTLRSSLYVLQHPDVSAADASRAQAVIDRQSRHLVRMVDDLLDVTRINSGKIRLQRSRVDLVDLVRRTVDDHHALIGSRKLDLVVPDHPIWLDGDPTRVAQVLQNLISNAVKFTTEHGWIAVDLEVQDDGVVLEITDDGVGLDEATLAQLFKPFMQVDRSLDRNRGGLGLGLALVKALVELHGGSVSARSAGHLRGACFTVRFPQHDVAPASAGRTKRGRKILVIDDNPDFAAALAVILRLWKHQVSIAFDGNIGLLKARELEPDVVICDIGLPGALNGYAVARALRDDPVLGRAYRIAMTGYAQPEDQDAARAAGFQAHLAKPADLDLLHRLIAEAPA